MTRMSAYGIDFDPHSLLWRIQAWDGPIGDQRGRVLGWSSWDSAAEARDLLDQGQPFSADYVDDAPADLVGPPGAKPVKVGARRWFEWIFPEDAPGPELGRCPGP
jgi:hypothetical protein